MSEVARQFIYRLWLLEDMRASHRFRGFSEVVADAYADEASVTLHLLGGMAGEW